MMELKTHLAISPKFCGQVVSLEAGRCEAKLETVSEMAADDRGLVHGGFIFGLADYAAMAAVNHPNVVLGASECSFLKPVTVGQTVVAKAALEGEVGRKNLVRVEAFCGETLIFKGSFTCFVLDKHVLDR